MLTITPSIATTIPTVKPSVSYAYVEAVKVATRTTHDDIKRSFSNMLEAKGAVVHNESELVRDNMDHRKNWNADIVATFGKVTAIVEVKPLKVEDFGHAIKQVLFYASVIKSDRPVVCIVTNGVDFIAFNPANFSLVALKKNRTVCPSMPDPSALRSLKRQVAYKALKTNKVSELSKLSGLAVVRFLAASVGVTA